MFTPTSRYYALPTKQLTTLDGRRVTYVQRRFVPPASTFQRLGEVVVRQGDRLDNITARTLGDPEQFWQLCDANNAMNPPELTAEFGRRLRIPVPQV
jgi:hypothetical protein